MKSLKKHLAALLLLVLMLLASVKVIDTYRSPYDTTNVVEADLENENSTSALNLEPSTSPHTECGPEIALLDPGDDHDTPKDH